MGLETQAAKISTIEDLSVCGPINHLRNPRRIYVHRRTTYASKFREPAVASDEGDLEAAV